MERWFKACRSKRKEWTPFCFKIPISQSQHVLRPSLAKNTTCSLSVPLHAIRSLFNAPRQAVKNPALQIIIIISSLPRPNGVMPSRAPAGVAPQPPLSAPPKESKKRLSARLRVYQSEEQAPEEDDRGPEEGGDRDIRAQLLSPPSCRSKIWWICWWGPKRLQTPEEWGVGKKETPQQSEQVIVSIAQPSLNIRLNNWTPLSPIWMAECCGSTTPAKEWGQCGWQGWAFMIRPLIYSWNVSVWIYPKPLRRACHSAQSVG